VKIKNRKLLKAKKRVQLMKRGTLQVAPWLFGEHYAPNLPWIRYCSNYQADIFLTKNFGGTT